MGAQLAKRKASAATDTVKANPATSSALVSSAAVIVAHYLGLNLDGADAATLIGAAVIIGRGASPGLHASARFIAPYVLGYLPAPKRRRATPRRRVPKKGS